MLDRLLVVLGGNGVSRWIAIAVVRVRETSIAKLSVLRVERWNDD